jgi:hypothetical protein
MAKKRKRNKSPQQKIRKWVKGLIISWEDTNPLSASSIIDASEVSHTKAIMRLVAPIMVSKNHEWIFRRARYLWLIKIDIIYMGLEGHEPITQLQLEAWCNMDDVSDVCKEEIEAARAEDADKEWEYRTTRFTVECISSDPQ